MAHIIPRQRKELPELEPILQMVEASMGFLPTSMMTMAHWPELAQVVGGLGATVLNSGELNAGLKQMIAFAVSNAAGCHYCQAHTANSAQKKQCRHRENKCGEGITTDLLTLCICALAIKGRAS